MGRLEELTKNNSVLRDDSVSELEELVLYSRSGDSLARVCLHKFGVRPEILVRSERTFVWDEDRERYREASVLSTTPAVFDQKAATGSFAVYDRGGKMIGGIALPRDADPPDIVHCSLWQFVWDPKLKQYREALVVRVYPK